VGFFPFEWNAGGGATWQERARCAPFAFGSSGPTFVPQVRAPTIRQFLNALRPDCHARLTLTCANLFTTARKYYRSPPNWPTMKSQPRIAARHGQASCKFPFIYDESAPLVGSAKLFKPLKLVCITRVPSMAACWSAPMTPADSLAMQKSGPMFSADYRGGPASPLTPPPFTTTCEPPSLFHR